MDSKKPQGAVAVSPGVLARGARAYAMSTRPGGEQQVGADALRDVKEAAAALAKTVAGGKPLEELTARCVSDGADPEEARPFADLIFKTYWRARLKAARGRLAWGIGALVIGGLITGITYSAASSGGGTYVVTQGAFIFGPVLALWGGYDYWRAGNAGYRS